MLEINDLEFSYNKKEESLFSKLSLKISEGEVVSLLGSSGSGKSTIARLIAGFETPSKGEIKVDSKTVFKLPELNLAPQKRDVSIVFQDFGLFPFLSVEENIKLWSEDSKQSADPKLINSLEIKELLNRKVSTLSGGQKQRVGLARALIANPKLLILDEPLSQLDELSKYRFLDYFKEISSKLTCLWITHNPVIALKVSDKVCYLGSKSLLGPVEPDLSKLAALHPDLATLTKYL